MIAFIASIALAEPVDAPLRAAVPPLPPGPARLALPGELVGGDPASLARTLRVQDAEGRDVPFTVALSTEPLVEPEHLEWRPVEMAAWVVEAAERPVGALRLDVSDLADHGPVEVRIDDGPPTLLYEVSDEGVQFTRNVVELPRSRGPWTVRMRAARGSPLLTGATGLASPDQLVQPNLVRVQSPVGALDEGGFVRYGLDLGGMRRVVGVAVEASDETFSRTVTLSVPTEGEPSSFATGAIRRMKLAGAAVEHLSVGGVDQETDRLILDIPLDSGRPLAVTALTVLTVGAEVVLPPAAQPLTVYAGGEPHDESGDAAIARPELMRTATARVELAGVEANPAYVPAATREGIDAPGAAINLAKWGFARAVLGEGWVRIPLDRAVLAHAAVGLADLRLVDADGRQVPYVLRRSGGEADWEDLRFSREEKGAVSHIRVELGDEAAPVATLRLSTGRDLFTRDVSVLRDRGTVTETLRRVSWAAADQGGTVALRIDEVVGKTLLIRIDNGDNPPLPVTAVAVTSPLWELRAKVPPGTRLVYGARGQSSPWYDLSLLQDELRRDPLADAALGPVQVLGGVQTSAGERMVVWGAIGLLALGLVAMTFRVLRGAGPVEEAA
jgi:hypothetical protein